MNNNFFRSLQDLSNDDIAALDQRQLYGQLRQARLADKDFAIIPKALRRAKWNQNSGILSAELIKYIECINNYQFNENVEGGVPDSPNYNEQIAENTDIKQQEPSEPIEPIEPLEPVQPLQPLQPLQPVNAPQIGDDYKVFGDFSIFGETRARKMRGWLNGGLGIKICGAFDEFVSDRNEINEIALELGGHIKSLRADTFSQYNDTISRLPWFGNQHGTQVKKMGSIVQQIQSVGMVMNGDINYLIENNQLSYRMAFGGMFKQHEFNTEKEQIRQIINGMVLKAMQLRKNDSAHMIQTIQQRMVLLEEQKENMEELDYLRQMDTLRREQMHNLSRVTFDNQNDNGNDIQNDDNQNDNQVPNEDVDMQ
eukprot:12777_1